MTARETNKMHLSKSILEMKFMKRTKEKVEKQIYQQEGEEYFGSQLTTRMKKESGKFIIEPSFAFCEQLRDGRVSYQGMNPEIERLMELEENAKRMKEEVRKEADVSDEQMARRWKSSEVATMENRFKTKRQRVEHSQNDKVSNKRRSEGKYKFLKPSD